MGTTGGLKLGHGRSVVAQKLGPSQAAVRTSHGNWREGEARLAECQLLPDVDFCRHALALAEAGRVPSRTHLIECAVCIRRWRVVEACIQGWQPMGHADAESLLPQMARAFSSQERMQPYRPFYAHLARCRDCELELAWLSFDAIT